MCSLVDKAARKYETKLQLVMARVFTTTLQSTRENGVRLWPVRARRSFKAIPKDFLHEWGAFSE
jgi:hypothetical protein